MKNDRKNRSWTLALIALYVSAVAIRFLLALLTRKQISINIDEYLYTGLARSIGTGDGLLFRGQTADYSYFAFPLFLSPIYALFPNGTDFFRLLQLWSILLMQASVFPIYGIASILLGEKGKKPLCAAAVCLLVPDFIFGNIIFSECLIYPLFFTAVYLAFRELESPRWTNAVGIGVCAALLYETKPGQVVFPVVFVLMSAFWAIRSKNKKAFVNAFLSAITGILVIALFRLLIGGFSSFGVYGSQLKIDTDHFDRFLLGCFLYPVCFVLACGVGCFFFPLQRIREMPANAKRILTVSIVSLLVLIVGTSWVINRHEYADDAMHVRYIAMFIPIMFLYTLSAQNYSGLRDAKRGNFAALGKLVIFAVFVVWVAAAILLPSLSVFRDETVSYFASFSILYALVDPGNPLRTQTTAVLVCAFAFVMCLLLLRKKKYVKNLCVGVFIAVITFNNVLGYIDISNSFGNNTVAYDSGNEVLDFADGDDYLYVSTDLLYGSYSRLTVNSRQKSSYVLWNDLFNTLYAEKGVYKPCIPSYYIRGTVPDRELIDTDLIIMDETVFALLKPSEDVEVFSTPYLSAIRIKPGERWLDSMIGNISHYKLDKGVPGILILFDEKYFGEPMRIRMDVECDRNANLSFRSETEAKTISLTPGRQWIDAEFTRLASSFNFKTDDCDIKVYGYEIVPQ